MIGSKWGNPKNPILNESLVKISENHEFSDFVGSPPCEPGCLPTARAGQPAAAALVLGGRQRAAHEAESAPLLADPLKSP